MRLENTVRIYGDEPFRVAALHGGPGAPGYMAPVARELSCHVGVLEPLQTADSLDGQIDELRAQLSPYDKEGFTLIGSSWGAVIAIFLAGRYKGIAEKLILVGSAVFDEYHSSLVKENRLNRLAIDDRRRIEVLASRMKGAAGKERDAMFKEWADLHFEPDVYDPLTRDLEVIETQPLVNERVWNDFKILRDEPGRLQREFSGIDIPVVVIHGDYDPHPIDGIRPYLSQWIPQTSFHILANCGHYPWIEKHARDEFFRILRTAISV